MIDQLELKKISGLSQKKASQRLEEEGYNELPSSKKRGFLVIFLEIITEPMFILLLGGGGIYLILGDLKEAVILLSFVFVVISITFFQEKKTENSLEALRNLSSPRALVLRDGVQERIAGREVVREDIVILTEGDRVPADAFVMSSSNLLVDESLLTGESMAVRKTSTGKEIKDMRPGGDDLPFVYSGTLVVQGYGIAKVTSIGINTEIGKIGKALKSIKSEKTLLEKETKKLVFTLATLGIFLSLVVVVTYGLTRHDWLHGILAGITFVMAMLPEEFPVVLTIFLAIGAWRISKNNVLTRKIPAVETLGSATVLCVDKTGTLTLNKMSVSKLFVVGGFYDIPNPKKYDLLEEFHELVEFGFLASQKDAFDTMEKAIKDLSDHALANTEHIHKDWRLVKEYTLSRELLSVSHVWQSPEGDGYVIAAKGAPESIFDLCHLTEQEQASLTNKINMMAKDNLRVIAVAKAYFKKETDLPLKQHDFDFHFLGLIGLTDPIRPDVDEAIKECYRAGIRVVMITGDYPNTALNIAKQIGLSSPDGVLTGTEVSKMNEKELKNKVKNINVFARMVPEQKLLLVNALKDEKEIVAMTGDGVNDAPALKSAHIGVAMGGRGTDVAREASDLVLLDDNFISIVKAVRLGRRIFDNLKKAVVYILAVHIPIAGMSFIPLFFNLPLVLMPVHIAFLELIIDPACSIVLEVEKEEANVMKRPPRSLKEPLANKRNILLGLLQGFSALTIILTIFFAVLFWGKNEADARTFVFASLVITNLGLILTNRSWSRSLKEIFLSKNKSFWLVSILTIFFLLCVLYTPFLQKIFFFSTLHLIDLTLCLLIGLLSILWFEALKSFINNKKTTNSNIE